MLLLLQLTTISTPCFFTSDKTVQKRQRYYILLVLTDGDADDMEQTKEEIIKAAKLPMSIIIVGLGGNSFEKMIELDADDPGQKIRGKFSGEECERDIVQFVPFRKLRDQAGLLEDETLREIPTQFMRFMTEKKIKPKGNKAVTNDQSPEMRLKFYDPTRLSTAAPPIIKSQNQYFMQKEKKMTQELIQMGFPEDDVLYIMKQGLPADNKLLAIDILISKGIMLDKTTAATKTDDKDAKSEEKAKKEAYEKTVETNK